MTADVPQYQEGPPDSKENKVPRWLMLSYILLPIWGIIAFYLYWNGSSGWLDRGYWFQLQQAANTTFPYVNESSPSEEKP